MSVSTKGAILTDCKNVMLVCSLVERSLDRLINCERRFAVKPARRDLNQFAACRSELIASSGMVQTSFTFKGNQRTLSIFFDCDCDHQDLAPKSISMSMGCEGYADMFVKTVLHALSVLGPAYFDHSDSDDIALAPLDEYTPTVFQALRLHYLTAPRVEDWITLFDAGLTFPKQSFRKTFGVTREWAMSVLQDADFKSRWITFEEAAKRQELPELKFMSEYHQMAAAAAAEAA